MARNQELNRRRAPQKESIVARDPVTKQPREEYNRIDYGDLGHVNDGLQRTWYADGALESYRPYAEGRQVGVWTTYWRTGLLRSWYEFDAASPSPMTWWHANGIVASHGMARNGQRTGHWIYRYEHGPLKSEGAYANGRQHGVWTEYDEEGVWRERGKYVIGKRQGDWEYNRDARPKR